MPSVIQQVGGAVGVGLGTTVARGAAGACARLRAGVADGRTVGECDGLAGFGAADVADAAVVAAADAAVAEAAVVGAADEGAGVTGAGSLPAPYI